MALTLAGTLTVAAVAGLPSAAVAAAAQDSGPPHPVVNVAKTDPSAATPASVSKVEPQEPQPTEPGDQSRRRHSDHELQLSYSILGFGGIVLLVQYLLLRKPARDPASILQLLSINLIVTGTLFLITAGFDAQAISPGLGLLGTIAGYVLGRRSADGGNTPPPPPEAGHDQK